ncbi:hypothetical protein ACN4EG_24710 [Alkalinema pantanalense CENA528]|uniref:hypothetical protein n=1 Tax=Alkalinema pantanalense TaxID=1620705 RepID=UPI003D6DC1F0
MTPSLEAAIAAIQPLSPTEHLQLLQILMQSSLPSNFSTDLKALSLQFRQGISLQQLQATQSPKIVENLQDLAADFWPAEDSIEEFLAFLQQQRQELA